MYPINLILDDKECLILGGGAVAAQKAKGLLMRQLGMTEQDAHRWIEKAAMDRCVKKREIAETIIRMYEL